MKICYLVHANDIHAQRWVNHFKNRGHEIFVITSQRPVDLGVKQYELGWGIPLGSRYVHSAFRHVFSPFSIYQIWRILKKERPDIVHTYYASHYGFIAALVNYHPLLLTALGSDILVEPKSRIFIIKHMVKLALKKADWITCEADNLKEALIEFGADSKKLSQSIWAVDVKQFYPQSRNKKISMSLQIDDSPIVISLRNLEPLYNLESLINSVPIVINKVPKVKFLIVGEGSQKAKLIQLTQSLGVSNHVIFTGWIPHDQLPQFLSLANMYVSTALSDGGFALNAKEAMACGLPVIVTDFGDNRKWVKDYVNGFVIPPKSPKVLASKIIYLLRNKEARIKMGQANRLLIEENANWEKEMTKMERLYEELITINKSKQLYHGA